MFDYVSTQSSTKKESEKDAEAASADVIAVSSLTSPMTSRSLARKQQPVIKGQTRSYPSDRANYL